MASKKDFPPSAGYTALLNTGAIVYEIQRTTPRGRTWVGENRLNPKHPMRHSFTTDVLVFAAPADKFEFYMRVWQEEQKEAQEAIRRMKAARGNT